jgi:hypothetical protein
MKENKKKYILLIGLPLEVVIWKTKNNTGD